MPFHFVYYIKIPFALLWISNNQTNQQKSNPSCIMKEFFIIAKQLLKSSVTFCNEIKTTKDKDRYIISENGIPELNLLFRSHTLSSETSKNCASLAKLSLFFISLHVAAPLIFFNIKSWLNLEYLNKEQVLPMASLNHALVSLS